MSEIETDAPAQPDGARDAEHRRAAPGIDGVSAFFGMRWSDPQTVHLTITPELINAAGLLSGVVAYAMIDYCMGSALWVHTTEDESIATVNIAINYIQTATEGEVVCRSTVDRRNRSSATLRSEVRDEGDRLLATAIGSFAIYVPRERRQAP
ncbi:MAG: PaaI family thioesterase [Solirubrobacteraceae bacterium]